MTIVTPVRYVPPMDRRFCRVAIALVLVIGFVQPGVAQASKRSKRAVALSLQAIELHRAGRFEEAARRFLEAYALSKRPIQLRNAAKSMEQSSRLDEALELWQRFGALPGLDPRDAAEATAHADIIRARWKEQEASQRLKAATLQAEAARVWAEAARKDAGRAAGHRAAGQRAAGQVDLTVDASPPAKPWLAYVAVAGGAALMVSGGVLLGLSQSRVASLDDKLAQRDAAGVVVGISREEAQNEVAAVNRDRIVSGSLLGVGALTLGIAAAILLADDEVLPTETAPAGRPGLPKLQVELQIDPTSRQPSGAALYWSSRW